jgi:hypothetical protein
VSDILRVRVVCNDDAGAFTGCAQQIDVVDILSLVAVSETRPPRLALIEFDGVVRMMRISGRSFPVRMFQNYVGDHRTASLGLEPCVLAELLNYLRNRGFTCEGRAGAAEMWESQGRFNADFLRRCL